MPTARAERSRAVVVGAAVLLVVVLGVAASLVMRIAGAGVPYWYTIALAAVLVSLVQLGRWTLRNGDRASTPDFGPDPVRSRTVSVLAPVERRLVNATRDKRLYTTRLRPTLYALARERVRRHGGPDLGELDDLGGSPRARTVLGEELWRWLTDLDQIGTPPDLHQVTRLVAAVERL